jgi:hypothetical protein
LLALFGLCIACEGEARVRQARSPDGKPGFLIECGSRRALCDDELQEMCGGHPIVVEDRVESVLVRCR